MNVKIQGSGNGTYANTGSCVAVTNYLQHEDLERMKKGEEVQPFFNQFRDYVSAREVTFKIDNNKAKLSRTDAKFYVITVSPSEKELRCMGRTPQECAEALRRYIRQDVMRNYAEGFGKGLKSDDVEYYAKIHFNRDGESDSDMVSMARRTLPWRLRGMELISSRKRVLPSAVSNRPFFPPGAAPVKAPFS